MAETILSSGLSFGGTKAQVVEEHPAIAVLMECIAALRADHPRVAVEKLEQAMDIVAERESMMVEF